MKGFTLIEILIVIAILFVLAALGIGALPVFQKTANLNSSVEDGVSFLLQARSKTLSGEGGVQHGVHFESGKIVLFDGIIYSSADLQNEEIILPATVELVSIVLDGGGSEVIFKKLTGETDQYGTVEFRLKSNTSKTRVLTILKMGAIFVE